ncbi:hypothetical protein ACP4OV_027607 [Aristida adscensionis]
MVGRKSWPMTAEEHGRTVGAHGWQLQLGSGRARVAGTVAWACSPFSAPGSSLSPPKTGSSTVRSCRASTSSPPTSTSSAMAPRPAPPATSASPASRRRAFEWLSHHGRHRRRLLLPPQALADALRSCGARAALAGACALHGRLVVVGLASVVFLQNTLLHADLCCGALADARCLLLADIAHPNLYTHNITLNGYAKLGRLGDAPELFARMPQRRRLMEHVHVQVRSERAVPVGPGVRIQFRHEVLRCHWMARFGAPAA